MAMTTKCQRLAVQHEVICSACLFKRTGSSCCFHWGAQSHTQPLKCTVAGPQDKLGNMERELEWVRGELGEERAAASRRGEDAAGRAREASSAVTRLKSLHREELKRANRDRQQLTERVQVCPCPWPGCHAPR